MTNHCKICFCTDTQACPEGCYWIKPGLCSACHANRLAPLLMKIVEFADFMKPVDGYITVGKIDGRWPVYAGFEDGRLVVRDHLHVPIIAIDSDGYSCLLNYDPEELLPLFEVPYHERTADLSQASLF